VSPVVNTFDFLVQPHTVVTRRRSETVPTIDISMHEYLESVAELSGAKEDWRPISRGAVLAWLAFYAVFLIYAFNMHGGYLFIDSANLVVHEGGHLLFAWFGPTLCLWGGTILQWMVPLLLAAYFFHERQTTAFVFSCFSFLRTGSTPRLTWPTPAPWFCRS